MSIDLFDDYFDPSGEDELLFSADVTAEQVRRFCHVTLPLSADISARWLEGAKTFLLFLLEEEATFVDGPSEEERDEIASEVTAAFERRLADMLTMDSQKSPLRGPFEETLFTADITVSLLERFCQLVCASHSNLIALEELSGALQYLELMLEEETQFSELDDSDETDEVWQKINAVFAQYLSHLGARG